LRISTQAVFGATMSQARQMLADWTELAKPIRVWCDLAALEKEPAPSSGKVTDYYLANLAEKHGMALATLDRSITHRVVSVIPDLPLPDKS
jgi:predicted nucleic acid-binding protein